MDYRKLIEKDKETLTKWISENPAPLLRWLYDRSILTQSQFYSLVEKTPDNCVRSLLDLIFQDQCVCKDQEFIKLYKNQNICETFLQILREVQDYYCIELESWLHQHYKEIKTRDPPAIPDEPKKKKSFSLFRSKKTQSYNVEHNLQQPEGEGGSFKNPHWRVELNIHKRSIIRKTENITDNVEDSISRTHIEIRYTDLFVTDDDSSLDTSQHEYFSLANRRARIYNHHKYQRIKPRDLLSPLPGIDRSPRRAKVKGIAGIGKSIAMQRVMHEWAMGITMRNFTCIFDFTFRELNLLEGNHSLVNLISRKFNYLERILPDLLKKPKYLLFLLDGLDEFKYQLDFEGQEKFVDVTTEVPVQELVVSLLKGSLLPEASVITTTRPSSDIPTRFCHRSSIILGFEEQQVEEYCLKFYKDSKVSRRVYEYISENDSLFGLTFIPLYCYIICTALNEFFTSSSEKPFELSPPKTVGEVYYCYLYTVLRHHTVNTSVSKSVFSSVKNELMQLGRLAYHNLLSNKILFDKNDLENFGFAEKSFHNTFLSQILVRVKEKEVKMFAFFHMTIQEHLAALYCVVKTSNEDFLKSLDLWCFGTPPADPTISAFLSTSTNLMEKCKLENMQMFTRFFMGLVTAGLEGKLNGLDKAMDESILVGLCQWFKTQFQKNLSNQQVLNLLHCLMELQQDSVVKEVAQEIKTVKLFKMTLNLVDCVALHYVLQYSNHNLEELNLGYSNIGNQGLKRLETILHKCETLFLRYSCLDKEAAILESEVLKSPDCQVKKLFMCGNNIGSEGVLQLWTALETNQTLEELYLDITGITEEGTETIIPCLSKNTTLKTLIIVGNDLGDIGKKRLQELSKRRSSLKIIGNFVEDLGLLEAYLAWVEEMKEDRDQMESVKNVNALQSVLNELSFPAQGSPDAREKAKELKEKITELLNSPQFVALRS